VMVLSCSLLSSHIIYTDTGTKGGIIIPGIS
jgi:hypothetical protein